MRAAKSVRSRPAGERRHHTPSIAASAVPVACEGDLTPGTDPSQRVHLLTA